MTLEASAQVGAGWRRFFWVAAIFNFVIGIAGMLTPDATIDARIIGLLVFSFGVIYALVARDALRFAPVLWAGVLGKVGVVALLAPGSFSAEGDPIVAAVLVQEHGTALALGAALAVGAGCGLLSGALVAFLKLPPFVTTLAVMTIARGLALIASNGQPIRMGAAGDLITEFGVGRLGPVPYPVILMLAVFVLAGLILRFTRFGRMVKAVGSNAEAVRLSGISISRYEVAVYAISGGLAAVAGVVSASRTGIGSATISVGAELDAIAAVVIGGTLLTGGYGFVGGTFFGILIMGLVQTYIVFDGTLSSWWTKIVIGGLLFAFILLQKGLTWAAEKRAAQARLRTATGSAALS